MPTKIVDYEKVVEYTKDPNVLIVDVREPSELKSTGKIDGSINIPLGTLEDVLKNMADDKFESTFGKKKPNLDFALVFSCKAGGRAAKAADMAANLGFKNVSSYKGSWTEWEQKLKENN